MNRTGESPFTDASRKHRMKKKSKGDEISILLLCPHSPPWFYNFGDGKLQRKCRSVVMGEEEC